MVEKCIEDAIFWDLNARVPYVLIIYVNYVILGFYYINLFFWVSNNDWNLTTVLVLPTPLLLVLLC